MLTELCAYLKNYFLVDYRNIDKRIHYGTFTIENGRIQPLDFLQDGQYYRIVGSVFNDGVWQYHPPDEQTEETEESAMEDEVFSGSIWAMNIPPKVVALAHDIEAWIAANSASVDSPYQSESFGGYSYSLKSGSSAVAGGSDIFGWQSQFAAQLAPYRRLSVL
jgi:hypothetical protein